MTRQTHLRATTLILLMTVITDASDTKIRNIGKRCYSVNRYKPLQNQLLRKPLQTVTNSYKTLQTSYLVNRYKPLRTITNRYKLLQTIYSINRYEPLQYQSDTTV